MRELQLYRLPFSTLIFGCFVNHRKVHWTDGWVPALYSCSFGGYDCQMKTGNLSTELGSNPAFGLAVGQRGQLYLATLHNQSLYRSSLDLELTSVQIATSETKTFFLIKKETSLPAGACKISHYLQM